MNINLQTHYTSLVDAQLPVEILTLGIPPIMGAHRLSTSLRTAIHKIAGHRALAAWKRAGYTKHVNPNEKRGRWLVDAQQVTLYRYTG